MTRAAGAILFLPWVFLVSVATATQGESPELRAKLDAQGGHYSLAASGLADAVIKLSQQFELPLGIEWVRDKEAERPLSRAWTGESVRHILRSVVEEYPGYDFRPDGGVIHVFRKDLPNDAHNFLNLRVPDFLVERHEAAGLANMRLRVAMQNIVSPRPLPPGAGEAIEYATGIREKAISVRIAGLTIRNALGRLAAVSEHNVWVVTFSASPELTPTGFRRTETLWHPAPFPNNQQPMWDFLAWSEYRGYPRPGGLN
jgi:hypothetical protein